MEYQKFVTEVKEKVAEKLEGRENISLQETVKNNGVKKLGLHFTSANHGDEKVSLTLYMEEFYQFYTSNQNIELPEVVDKIISVFNERKIDSNLFALKLYDYEEMKSQIIYSLVNRKRNEDMLKSIPHVPFLNLEIIFRCVVSINHDELGSFVVTDEHMKLWKTNTESLFELAKANTERILPPLFTDIMDELGNIYTLEDLKEDSEKDWDRLYVLTNQKKTDGASVILYDGVLEKIGKELGGSYWIIPSSTEEVLILRERDGLPEEVMTEIIQSVNETEVRPEQVLSDIPYFYNSKTGMIE